MTYLIDIICSVKRLKKVSSMTHMVDILNE